MQVYITVDVEVWPARVEGWPRQPLARDNGCTEEIGAYLIGRTGSGDFGVPYQLAVLQANGLQATFFVDPFFSFALGMDPLVAVVRMIEDAGQSVALHVHPEWLTDPRCTDLPDFRGPMISSYPPDEQLQLITLGIARLREAGASPIPAFRAGSWGADLSTLAALRKVGIQVDCSLNARMPHSFGAIADRGARQDAAELAGVVELPASRLYDRTTPDGRVISLVGNSAAEIEFTLNACLAAGRRDVVLVLHSNEFVKTERLWQAGPVTPRRLVRKRFEDVSCYLGARRNVMPTCVVTDAQPGAALAPASTYIPHSHLGRTILRQVGQVVSRWY